MQSFWFSPPPDVFPSRMQLPYRECRPSIWHEPELFLSLRNSRNPESIYSLQWHYLRIVDMLH